MAIVANTFLTYSAIGNREELADLIADVSPTATPFLSNAGSASAESTKPEWQMDVLAAASDANAHLQGDETAFDAVTPTTRVGNYTQILKKSVIVSRTQEQVSKAGRNSEIARELIKKGKELKRDLEKTLLGNQGGVGGNSTTAPKLASLGAWVKTNDSFGATGASPVWTSGVPAAGRTDGTQRAFTEALLKPVLRDVFSNSMFDASVIMLGPFNKQAMSSFTGIAQIRYNAKGDAPASIIGAADIYVSDFGNLSVVPNRFQRDRDAWVLDFDQISIAWLQPWMEEELAKTGDAHKRHILGEMTLRVEQEAALGLVADLTTV